MQKTIAFTVYGMPIAKARPRFMARPYIDKASGQPKAFTQAYTPKETVMAEDDFKTQALKYRPAQLILGAVWLTVKIYRSIPKGFSVKKEMAAESGDIRPISKPDWDNYGKLVSDSLNSLFWHDDSQVVDGHVQKFYSRTPRTEIEIRYEAEVSTL